MVSVTHVINTVYVSCYCYLLSVRNWYHSLNHRKWKPSVLDYIQAIDSIVHTLCIYTHIPAQFLYIMHSLPHMSEGNSKLHSFSLNGFHGACNIPETDIFCSLLLLLSLIYPPDDNFGLPLNARQRWKSDKPLTCQFLASKFLHMQLY